jgi:hypothetical protein
MILDYFSIKKLLKTEETIMKTSTLKLQKSIHKQSTMICVVLSLFFFCSNALAFEYTPPEKIGVQTWQSYILVHGVKINSDPRDKLEKWLKNVELKHLLQDPAITQATLYRVDPPDDSQPDYYVIVRFDVLYDPNSSQNYDQISNRIVTRLNNVLKNGQVSLTTTHKLFYKEYHRGNRMQPRYSGDFTWEDQGGHTHTVTWGDSFGEDVVQPGPVKYADYGFSHSCNDEYQWDYIRWYQEVRQHDVIGPYGPYDNYRMWLIVPGQNYEYVLTMYEWSPIDYLPAAIAWGGPNGFYAYLTDKDTRDTESMAFQYCTGPRGHTIVIEEIYKDRP